MTEAGERLRVAVAQVAPVFLQREGTLEKVLTRVEDAAAAGCRLVVFGEALVPGYPVWTSLSDGARFDAPDQKALHARYLEQAVTLEHGHLEPLQATARRLGIAVVLGVVERPLDRGGHSLYCSRVYLGPDGAIGSVHRKLMPTHEERLSWAIGDGAGLVVHSLGGFRVGALNCWENWLPLARASLYALGENLHVALWPGGEHNTREITRFIARESRSYVLSVSGLLRAEDLPGDLLLRDTILTAGTQPLLNGGSCAVGPDGEWLLEPVVGEEAICVLELDLSRVYEERQNFDPAGHYARPDVLQLKVNRERQSTVAE